MARVANMPFRDSAIDMVTCFSVLDHLPNKNCVHLAISEFSRVVKNLGYVAIAFPNTFFIIGTVSMRMKQLLDSDAFFEQRFTPKEIEKIIFLSGLTPVLFGSKYPTQLGVTILEHNFPKIVFRVPQSIIKSLFSVAERVFRKLEKRPWLRQFGALIGFLSQKRPARWLVSKMVKNGYESVFAYWSV